MTAKHDIPLLCVGEEKSELAALISKLDQRNYKVGGQVCGLTEVFEALKAHSGPVLTIIDLGMRSDEAFRVAGKLKREFPNVHVAITSADTSSSVVLRALRAGAVEFLSQPFDIEETTEALDRIFEKIEIKPAQQHKAGNIVAVFSNKGGAGTTTVATNLAISLAAEQEKSVCLVDLDLQFGSASSVLNLDTPYTILDVVKNLERIDPLFLDGAMGKHPSGARILAAPNYAEEATRITATDVERILELLANEFDFVILDCSKRIDDVSMTALRKARLILFVMPMDIPSINLARKALDLFERARLPLDKCRLIVNRYVKTKELTLQSIGKALNTEVFHVLPLDYAVTISALNQGVSLAEAKPKSKIACSVLTLAEQLNRVVRVAAHENEREKRSLLGRLLPAFGS